MGRFVMSGAWTVLDSIENGEANRCVDIFLRPDGTFGFEEYRRDPEDAGLWTLVAYHAQRIYATREEAKAAARTIIAWLAN
jgi:hypothetical protein